VDLKYDILPAVLDKVWLKPGVHIRFLIYRIRQRYCQQFLIGKLAFSRMSLKTGVCRCMDLTNQRSADSLTSDE
jgi:hypothetical protein